MNTSGHNFEVKLSSGFSNPDRNNLSDSEKAMARGISGSEEAFREHKAEYLDMEDGIRDRGFDLGDQVKKVLEELGAGYNLTTVTWNRSTLSWRLEIGTPSGEKNVVLSWDLVDSALDARTPRELQRLRNMVWYGLGRHDLIFEKSK